MCAAKRADALIASYESQHVVAALDAWLEQWPETRFKFRLPPEHEAMFAFYLVSKTNDKAGVGGILIPHEVISACKSVFAAIRTAMDVIGCGSIKGNREHWGKLCFGSLPDTLSITLERYKRDEDGHVTLDATPLNCAKGMDFGEMGFEDLLVDGVVPKRYEMVAAIIGKLRVEHADKSKSAVPEHRQMLDRIALMRGPDGVWYQVNDPSKMRDYMCRGKPIGEKLLYEMMGCESGKLAPSAKRTTPYFVMQLFYRDHTKMLPVPPTRKPDDGFKWASTFLPPAFNDLFDSSRSERREGTAKVAEFIRTLVESEGGDRNKVTLSDVVKHAPPITHMNDIDYGAPCPLPNIVLELLDTAGKVLIGRSAYQLFRVRMLRELCNVLGIFVAEPGSTNRQEQAEAIVGAAIREWNAPLHPLDKLAWIAVADHFNRVHYAASDPVTSHKVTNGKLTRLTDNYDYSRGARMTARLLFAEQWPVLVTQKMEFDTLSPEEKKDLDSVVYGTYVTSARAYAQDPEDVNSRKRAIKLVEGDTLLMDQIWEEMAPASRQAFSQLAKGRNELGLLTKQGMCETWETMPFTMNEDGDGFDPSIFRTDMVRKAMPEFDPRKIKLKEFEDSFTIGSSAFINGHVMMAMQQELKNPSIDYVGPHFKMTYSDKVWYSEACAEALQNSLGKREGVSTTAIYVDPIKNKNIDDALLFTRTHAMYSSDGTFLSKQRAVVAKTPDTLAVRLSPHPVELRDPELMAHEGMDAKIGNIRCLNELTRRGVGQVPVTINRSMYSECISDDDADHIKYELVGLMYVKHAPRKFENGMSSAILHAGTHRGPMGPAKVSRQAWKSLTDTERPLTLISDNQRRAALALFEKWNGASATELLKPGRLDRGAPAPPATREQLEGMMRAAMGLLRISTGYVSANRGESRQSAVENDCEKTFAAVSRLKDLKVTARQFRDILDIVMERAENPDAHVQNVVDSAMRELEKAEMHETKDRLLHKAVMQNWFAPTHEEHVRILIRHMGRGEVWKDVYPGAYEPDKGDPASKVRTVLSGEVQEPEWCRTWFLHYRPGHSPQWSSCKDRPGPEIPKGALEEPPDHLFVGTDADGNEYTAVAYYRRHDNLEREANCEWHLWDMLKPESCDAPTKDLCLSLMSWSPFLREMLYLVSTKAMRAATAEKVLKVFMMTLGEPSQSRKSFEAAIKLIGDWTLKHNEFESFMTSRAFGRKGLAAYYPDEEKPKKKRPEADSGGWNGDTSEPSRELTEEEREKLAIEHAKELKRKWAAEAEARARSAAIEAERVERERRAAEEASAAAEALREQQKVAEAERVARAAAEAKVLREAREAKAARDKAVAEAKAAAENQKAKDEAAAKAAKAAMAKEERKAKRNANKERKHAPLDVKTQVTRDAAQRKQQQSSAQRAAELAAKMAADKEAKEAAAKERARVEAARTDAAAAAKEAAVKQQKAHKKAERVAALEAGEVADEAELAEAWLSSHSSQPSRSSDPAPPLSPVSTSTATSSRVLYEYENECIVCLSAPQTHLCTHCFNLALCGACAQTMTTCPVCREETEFRMVHRP